jgi:hypothetical protein
VREHAAEIKHRIPADAGARLIHRLWHAVGRMVATYSSIARQSNWLHAAGQTFRLLEDFVWN